jgi:transposase-like protein
MGAVVNDIISELEKRLTPEERITLARRLLSSDQLEALAGCARKTVNISQARERCGVSRRTIYNWLETGKVDYVRTPSGSVRIFVDTLFVKGNVPVGAAR